MKKKNVLMIALSLCLAAVIAVGATLAYFTDSTEKMSNVVTTGKVDIVLNDESAEVDGQVQGDVVTDGEDKQTGISYTDIMPGDVISKQVSVEKVANAQDCYVAIRVDVVDSVSGTVSIDDTHKKAIMDDIKATAAANHWSCYSEGMGDTSAIFYWNARLTGTDKVGLFDSVEIPDKEWGNEVVNASFAIDVKAAAVQAANLDAPAMVEFPESSNQYVANDSLGELVDLLTGTTVDAEEPTTQD